MRRLDATGLTCPLPVLKARKLLAGMRSAEQLEVLSSDPMSAVDLPVFCVQAGHRLITEEKQGDLFRFVIERGPEKPPWGATCNGCGYCCAAEVCPVGQKVYRTTQAPCPGLEFREGRFWCGAVKIADEIGRGPLIRLVLGIGFGCDSETPSSSTVA